MSTSQKIVKVTGFIMVLFALYYLFATGTLIAGFANATDDNTRSVAAALAGVAVVHLGLYVAFTVFAIRGANTPRKIGGYRVITLIVAVLSAISLAVSLANGVESLLKWSALLTVVPLVVSVVGFVKSNDIKKMAEK